MRITHTSKTKSGAFTLIELLVSVAILGMMIVGTGIVLTQADSVVSTSQSRMKANAEAAAIAQAIRDDFEGLTKDGFLAVVAPLVRNYGAEGVQNNTSSPGAIAFTSLGSFSARTPGFDGLSAGAAIICYSIRKDNSDLLNPTDTDTGTKSVLCREAHLLAARPSGGTWAANWDATDDITGFTLSKLASKYPRALLDYDILDVLAFDTTNAPDNYYKSVTTAPVTFNAVEALWPVMATGCTKFSIQWLDEIDDKWYGFDYKDNNADPLIEDYQLELNPKGSWILPIGSESDDAANAPEGRDRTTGGYAAMWSHHYNRTDSPKWPKAIKIKFTLTRPLKGMLTADHDYEVVCNVNQ